MLASEDQNLKYSSEIKRLLSMLDKFENSESQDKTLQYNYKKVLASYKS